MFYVWRVPVGRWNATLQSAAELDLNIAKGKQQQQQLFLPSVVLRLLLFLRQVPSRYPKRTCGYEEKRVVKIYVHEYLY